MTVKSVCWADVVKKLTNGDELTPEQALLRDDMEVMKGKIYMIRSKVVFIKETNIGYDLTDGNRCWFSETIPANAVRISR